MQVLPYPEEVLKAARKVADDVLAELAKKDALSGRIVESWLAARDHLDPWSDAALQPFFAAR